MENQPNATPFDPTIDANASKLSQRHDTHHAVALVVGSTPQLSVETNNLLSDRLRTASLLLFGGYLAFFIKSLFELDQFQTQIEWWLFWDHLAMTLVTAFVGWRLCRDCGIVMTHLRLAELAVFGGSGVFFFLFSWWMLLESSGHGYIRSIAPIWLFLMFTYALFIPNPLRRATIIIGAMAGAPISLVIGFWLASAEFADLVSNNADFYGYPIELSMILTLAAVIAVWGVKTIGTLRREAFEAKQLGQYRLKQQIGVGGMGEVYLAEHVLLKRPCAIKLIRPEQAGDAKSLARFEREVKATAKLTHWNTVEIFDYGRSDDGTFYYVMEYLPGLNLQELVEMSGSLPAERVIHLLMQTCEALGEAHRKGLIHRDIKPGNIFAANRGDVYDVVKLLDFGLAKPLADLGDTSLTQEGTITGSPLFMSPEQASGDTPADARSDIYALGTVGYYLLTGQPPFNDSNPMRVMVAHIQKAPPPLAESSTDVPADLSDVVMRCLQKDPAERFQTTDDFYEALVSCQAAGLWTREMARNWWECNGCPQKKALDVAVLEASV